MEEDIKILEEYLEEARDENSFTDCEGLFEDKFFISLDKLLKRYKELEEENKTYIAQLNGAFNRGFIPISVIQNKIDELEHEKFKRTQLGVFLLKNFENQRLLAQLQVLQELLEERNK